MTNALQRLIAEASVLAGGQHQCAALGHNWKAVGGRRCPRAPEEYEPRCSQTVFECQNCPAIDFGEPGGPGHADCYVNGPCDTSCVPE